MRSFDTKGQEDFTVPLPGGGTVISRKVTTASFDVAKAMARKKQAALLADPAALGKLGITAEDLDTKEVLEALYLGYLIEEVGARHITGWTLVANEDRTGDAEVTPENIRLLMRHPMAGKAYYEAVVDTLLPGVVIKKDLGIAAAGTSTAAPDTAATAST
jgi:hypothetical protein